MHSAARSAPRRLGLFGPRQVEHPSHREGEPTGAQLVVRDVDAGQVARHLAHHHRVLGEVAAVGVDHARAGPQSVGDDAVARLRHDHVDRTHEVDVVEAEAFEALLGELRRDEVAQVRRAPEERRVEPGQADPTEGEEDRRAVEAEAPPCLGAVDPGPARHETDVPSPREDREVAAEGELEEEVGPGIAARGQVRRGEEGGLPLREVAIDEVPGEVRERQRRHARPRGRREGERRDVAEHEAGAHGAQEGGLRGHPPGEGRVEGEAALGGGGLVDAKRVVLDEAHVALHPAHLERTEACPAQEPLGDSAHHRQG